MSSNQTPLTNTNQTIYFGYGSNLWLDQMRMRCPTSTYLGVARLPGYKWIINDRGYANVVQTSNSSSKSKGKEEVEDEVYGLVYSLLPTDEKRLDENEGVPIAYTKEDLTCEFWAKNEKKEGWANVSEPHEVGDMLVYIDRGRVKEDRPKKEYVYRMNRGIEDAVRMGVPSEYVDNVMRKFIPDDGKGGDKRKSLEEQARKQASRFQDESGVF